MSSDEPAVIGGYVRCPKYRADCIDWFHDPKASSKIDFNVPGDVRAAIEEAAERADRTFNDQFNYVLLVCRGELATDFEDERSVLEWRKLIREMRMQFHEGEEWIPCTVLFPDA